MKLGNGISLEPFFYWRCTWQQAKTVLSPYSSGSVRLDMCRLETRTSSLVFRDSLAAQTWPLRHVSREQKRKVEDKYNCSCNSRYVQEIWQYPWQSCGTFGVYCSVGGVDSFTSDCETASEVRRDPCELLTHRPDHGQSQDTV